jgi:endoribonuclease Nob1
LKSSGSYEYVLDANAFYSGLPFLSFTKCYTTSLVFEEVRHLKSSYSLLETLVETDNLRIVDPDEKFAKEIYGIAIKSGDYSKLSKADISVLALACQLGKTLISDDFAVENTAKLLGISIRPLTTKGIKHTRKWISFCWTCGKGYGPNITECLICGNRLKRRSKRLRHFE